MMIDIPLVYVMALTEDLINFIPNFSPNFEATKLQGTFFK